MMQSLPSIRLRKKRQTLVTKINSTPINTVPLWETQLAQAVTIQRFAARLWPCGKPMIRTNELRRRMLKPAICQQDDPH
jgi:uncharacterized protein YaaN involved in tellurite resistance